MMRKRVIFGYPQVEWTYISDLEFDVFLYKNIYEMDFLTNKNFLIKTKRICMFFVDSLFLAK